MDHDGVGPKKKFSNLMEETILSVVTIFTPITAVCIRKMEITQNLTADALHQQMNV